MPTTTSVPLIPRTTLFGNPEKTEPRLSPDGSRLSYIAPVNGVLNVWVGSVGSDDFKPVTRDTERGIRSHRWAYDGTRILYLQDVGGNENWNLYLVDLATEVTTNITPFPDAVAHIIEYSKKRPHDLLVGLNHRDPTVHDLYRIDLKTGELTLVIENTGGFSDWVVDCDLNVRGAQRMRPDGGFDLLLRGETESDWPVAQSFGAEDAMTSGPVGFTADGNFLHMIDSSGANAGRLLKWSLATGERTILAEDPIYDVSGIIKHPDTEEAQAVLFERDRMEWEVLDPALQEDFDTLRRADNGDIKSIDRDSADENWLVTFIKDNAPVAYYSYRRQNRELTFLSYDQPALEKYTLASCEPISFTSRDGLTVHGYITFPSGAERSDLPMVLNVHGGPWAHDGWGFNPVCQWLANRGYAVLQVNYRGSTGYGKAFLNAGDREWGGKMHDDLVDAVAWAVDRGYADPNKIAIYGRSYGGFAALVGATFTPDLFCCAVDIVGVSNLVTFIRTIPPYWQTALDMFRKRVGDPDTEEEFLKSRSPLFKADRIKIPMLIVQGANDPRVKQVESEQIVEALKHNGVEHEYMLFEDEGHTFAKPENRLKFYQAIEKFLAKHLGGRLEE
jgi:dipeptidyl aminopeptidase/acylaminoacyl peptidase